MIPKVIHFCWFGKNELSPMARKCIASWHKYCPNYEIIEWNENNYHIDEKCDFVKEAYRNKKWAFVSDYARLDIINLYGGIYLDTDVELIKPLDNLVDKYNGYMGWQDQDWINTGLGFGSNANNNLIEEMLKEYESIKFDLNELDKFTCPVISTKVFARYNVRYSKNIQVLDDVALLPEEYLCPIGLHTGIVSKTENTISVHHFDGTWMPSDERLKLKLIMSIKRLLPNKLVMLCRKIGRKGKQ